MCAIENLFFRWEMQDLLHPQFAKVFKGFDPQQVEEYVTQTAERLQGLEENLERVRRERDAAQESVARLREDAYQQVADRIADVMRSADESAAELVRQAEEEANRRLAEASRRSSVFQRDAEAAARRVRDDAEAEAGRLHQEARETLANAQGEAERVLGGLDARRAAIFEELGGLRTQVAMLVGLLDRVVDGSPSSATVEPAAAAPDEEPLDVIDLSSMEETIDLLHATQSAGRTGPEAGTPGADTEANEKGDDAPP
jgi:cell division septum initiation protein DivIVA